MMAEHMKRLEDVVFDFLDGPHLFAVLLCGDGNGLDCCVRVSCRRRAGRRCLPAGWVSEREDRLVAQRLLRQAR
jgi:8-oxo-dGTP pyrophosphatase MutT (NUDIX family)